jgi:hypothetical protein
MAGTLYCNDSAHYSVLEFDDILKPNGTQMGTNTRLLASQIKISTES